MPNYRGEIMNIITYNNVKGVFIPYEEFKKGKFLDEKKLIELQKRTLEQREKILELEKEILK